MSIRKPRYRRQARIALAVLPLALGAATLTATDVAASRPVGAQTADRGSLDLLTDPFLQQPGHNTVEVAWFTEVHGGSHHVLVGDRVAELSDAELRRAVTTGRAPGIKVHRAATTQLSRTAEDPQSQLPAGEEPAPASPVVTCSATRPRSRTSPATVPVSRTVS
ncbi:MAG: hypothetical protein ACLGIZ_11625 [Acidimicrobiia bacterium]